MKPIFTAAALLMLAGCATTSSAPAQPYRAAGQVDQWSISGTATKTTGFASTSYAVAILINGRAALSGTVEDSTADFTGTHEGKRIESSCVKVLKSDFWNGDSETLRCTVFINNERAATLSLGT